MVCEIDDKTCKWQYLKSINIFWGKWDGKIGEEKTADFSIISKKEGALSQQLLAVPPPALSNISWKIKLEKQIFLKSKRKKALC